MSNKVFTYPDGSIYVERPGTRWGRINMQYENILIGGHTNEVMARAVQDTNPPKGTGKGSTIPISLDWFNYLGNFHTEQAQRWLMTPFMLWTNRLFIGDALGSKLSDGADPQPVLECISGPLNIRRIIGETSTHYEVYSLPTSAKPSNYDPKVFNFQRYPWIFWKAQARTANYQVQNVGSGLDVYHMNVRKPNTRHYMNKADVTLFIEPPFVVSDGISKFGIVDYMFLGVNIYGITDNGVRVPLLIAQGATYSFPTDWRCAGPFLIPAK